MSRIINIEIQVAVPDNTTEERVNQVFNDVLGSYDYGAAGCHTWHVSPPFITKVKSRETNLVGHS